MTNKYLRQFSKLRMRDFFLQNCELKRYFEPSIRNDKEVTEALAVIRELRHLKHHSKLKKNDSIYVVDVGSGIGRFSMIYSHLNRNENVINIDKNPDQRTSQFHHFPNVDFKLGNVFTMKKWFEKLFLYHDVILLTGIHVCRELAVQVIKLYNDFPFHGMVLIPCCESRFNARQKPAWEALNLSRYQKWCLYLADLIDDKYRFRVDKNILSPKNIVISAVK